MKGDLCFSKKNKTVRPVFNAFGSLLCWHLQVHWNERKRINLALGSITKALLEAIPSASESQADKNWARWRSHKNSESVFAGGQLTIAREVLDQAAEIGLISSENSLCASRFLMLLADLGSGKVAFEDDVLEHRISEGYTSIFSLAGIEGTAEKGKFLDVESNEFIWQSDFQKDFFDKTALAYRHIIDAKSHLLDSAFVALDELMNLERVIQGAHNVLDCREPLNTTDLSLVRELLLERHAHEAIGLVRQLQDTLKLTHRSGGNINQRVVADLEPIVARMRAEARNGINP